MRYFLAPPSAEGEISALESDVVTQTCRQVAEGGRESICQAVLFLLMGLVPQGSKTFEAHCRAKLRDTISAYSFLNAYMAVTVFMKSGCS